MFFSCDCEAEVEITLDEKGELTWRQAQQEIAVRIRATVFDLLLERQRILDSPSYERDQNAPPIGEADYDDLPVAITDL